MPITDIQKSKAFGPLNRRQHTKHGIVPKAAYDLVFR